MLLNNKGLRSYITGDDSETVADAVGKFRRLVETGDLGTLRQFLAEKGAKAEKKGRRSRRKMVDWCLDSKESSALILAARRFRPPVVQFLCESGADVNQADMAGWTALHWACSVKDPETVGILLAHGADVHSRSLSHGLLPRHLLKHAQDPSAAPSAAASTAATVETLSAVLGQQESSLDPAEVTHSLAIPEVVFAGGGAPKLVIRVQTPKYHSPGDYVQLFYCPPTTPELTARMGAYRYITGGERHKLIWAAEYILPGVTFRAIYFRADGRAMIASNEFTTKAVGGQPVRKVVRDDASKLESMHHSIQIDIEDDDDDDYDESSDESGDESGDGRNDAEFDVEEPADGGGPSASLRRRGWDWSHGKQEPAEQELADFARWQLSKQGFAEYVVKRPTTGSLGIQLGITGLVTSSSKAAAAAGLPVGVRIVAVDGVAVNGKQQILAAAADQKAGRQLVFRAVPGPKAVVLADDPASLLVSGDVVGVLGGIAWGWGAEPGAGWYRVLHKAVVREGIGLDSALVGVIEAGEMVHIRQLVAPGESGRTSARLERHGGGWVSETATDGTVLLATEAPMAAVASHVGSAGSVLAEHERRCLVQHAGKLSAFEAQTLRAHIAEHLRELQRRKG